MVWVVDLPHGLEMSTTFLLCLVDFNQKYKKRQKQKKMLIY